MTDCRWLVRAHNQNMKYWLRGTKWLCHAVIREILPASAETAHCPGIITSPHCTAAALGFNSDCLHAVQYWGQRTCHVPGVDTFYECAQCS